MKPNDEDLESTLPEEPLPEPDDLLAALVDAETEATPGPRTSKTLIAALLLSGLGIWQIVHVSNGGEPMFQLAPKAKAAPTKLHSDGRRPIGRVLQSTDPIAAYLERAKRGMTDQEIRWMIEDFEAAGLDGRDRDPFSKDITLRSKQQLWYLEAVVEALQLSLEQKSRARAKMDEMLRIDIEAFEQGIGGVTRVIEPTEAIPDESPIAPYADATTWLIKEAYAPWKLCELTRDQNQLTLRHWKTDQNDGLLTGPSGDPFGDSKLVIKPWVAIEGTVIQDPHSGNLTEIPLLEEAADFNGLQATLSYDGVIPISDAFPLTPDQKLADHRNDLGMQALMQARLLHPAQLRMGLLLDSELAQKVLGALDQFPDLALPDSYGKFIGKPTDEIPPSTPHPETPVDPLPEPDSK